MNADDTEEARQLLFAAKVPIKEHEWMLSSAPSLELVQAWFKRRQEWLRGKETP